jgi:glycosyltransferase involved in cell wall biosynthesis
MLVTDVGGLGEIIPHGKVGYVVQPEPKDIADAIFDFYENDRNGVFTGNVVHEKEKFSWGTMIETFEIVLDKINKNI